MVEALFCEACPESSRGRARAGSLGGKREGKEDDEEPNERGA